MGSCGRSLLVRAVRDGSQGNMGGRFAPPARGSSAADRPRSTPRGRQHPLYVVAADQASVLATISVLEDFSKRPQCGGAWELGKRLDEASEVAADRGVTMTAGDGGDPIYVSDEELGPA